MLRSNSKLPQGDKKQRGSSRSQWQMQKESSRWSRQQNRLAAHVCRWELRAEHHRGGSLGQAKFNWEESCCDLPPPTPHPRLRPAHTLKGSHRRPDLSVLPTSFSSSRLKACRLADNSRKCPPGPRSATLPSLRCHTLGLGHSLCDPNSPRVVSPLRTPPLRLRLVSTPREHSSPKHASAEKPSVPSRCPEKTVHADHRFRLSSTGPSSHFPSCLSPGLARPPLTPARTRCPRGRSCPVQEPLATCS